MFHAPISNGEGDASPIRLRALSLGAGVQSTTMALMAAHGELGPMPDCAIFADTGWEPKAVYEHLDWLMSPNVMPFPVRIVSAGNIRDQLLAAGQGDRWASIPAFAKTVTPAGASVPVLDEDEDGELVEIATRRTTTETVSIGMIRRQCTTDFKIVPIRRKVQELPCRGILDRDFDRRDYPRQAQLRAVAGQAFSTDRGADEQAGLPGLAAPARLSHPAQVGLYRLPVPRQCPVAAYARS